MAIPRFDGAANWAALTLDQQAEIGAAALEFVAGCHASEVHASGMLLTPLGRAAQAAFEQASDHLVHLAIEARPEAAWSDDGRARIPSSLGPICRECGCSQDDACEGGCAWAAEDLCTACLGLVPAHSAHVCPDAHPSP